jgi:hypothetical protein
MMDEVPALWRKRYRPRKDGMAALQWMGSLIHSVRCGEDHRFPRPAWGPVTQERT